MSKHKRDAAINPRSSRLVFVVGLTLLLLLIGSSVGFAQETPSFAGQVRAIDSDELGVTNPAGLAFSPAAGVFYAVEARGLGGGSAQFSNFAVVSASPIDDHVGMVRVMTAVSDPINMAFDGKASRLLLYRPASLELVDIAAGPGGELDSMTLTRHSVPRFGLRSPQGMAVDPASGRLFLLDSIGPRLVRIEPDPDGGFDSAAITRLDLVDANLQGLRGLAFNPANGHLYTQSRSRQMLYELTQTGRIVASYDISSLALGDPQGLAFAPSGDLTDDPSLMSLYIADSGLGAGLDQQTTSQAGGQIVEFSFDEMEPLADAAPTVYASLVQTIDTSAFHPPSPDPAGIAYIEPLDTLLVSDSEVDEMPMYFTGDNVFEISLNGSLLRTGTSVPDSYEPSGLAHDPANDLLFLADDNTKKIWMIDPGSDGLFFTPDDPPRTFFSTLPFGCTDAEGIAFDTWDDVLWLADGLNKELYRVAPGSDGDFGTADDEVSNWDTASLGMIDPGGIAFDAENGYLYIAGRPKKTIFHVKIDGSNNLVVEREVDTSAASPGLPAGLTLAPSTQDSGVMNIYLADRGVDNGTDPLENDGKVYEFYVPPLTADVVLTKSVEPAFASAGDPITYTLSFHNAGSSIAVDVVITDMIPAEVTVQSVFSSGVTIENSGESPPYVWWVQDLSTSDEGVIVVTGEVTSTLACFDSFTNEATITTASDDARPGNNSSSVTVAAGAGVTVDPLSETKPADRGTDVAYSLWVTNTGSCPDTFDVSVSGTDWTVSVVSTVGELGSGEGALVDVTVSVPADAPCGPESAIITFTSQGTGDISASSELITTVNPVFGVTAAPPTDTLSGLPGSGVTYTQRMTNTGNCIETFDLSASEPSWITDFPPTVGPLVPGLSLGVDVIATVPPDALTTDQDVVTMTFASQSNSVISATSILTTSVGVVYGVGVEPSTALGVGDPNTGVTYTLQVTNTGNYTDTFSVSTSSDFWAASAQPTEMTLAPNLSAAVVVTVTVPPVAQCGTEDHTTVTFTSQSSGTISASSVLTTSVNTIRSVNALLSDLVDSGDPGSEVHYTLLVRNEGNCADVFDISVSGATWPVSTTLPAVALPSLGITDVGVTVTVPLTAECGADVATVTFTSQNEPSAFDSSSLTTSANAASGMALIPSEAFASADPGTGATHSLWLTNTGNCRDTFAFSVAGDEWRASTLSQTVTLDPDFGVPVTVTVAVPPGSQCIDSDVATVTFTAQNDFAVSASSILTTSANLVSSLTLAPSEDIRSADPGSDAVYMLWLTNTGNCTDTFTVAALGDTWPISATPTLLELDAGVGASLAVTVSVPSIAQCGIEVATVTGTSNDGTAAVSSTLTTTANALRGVTVESSSGALSGNPGDPVVYGLSVTNDGNCADTFGFSSSGNAWTTSAPAVGPVDPGVSASVGVTVTVPPDALCAAQDITSATFTSAGDGATSSSSVLTTTANTVYGVMVEPSSAASLGDPGSGVVYSLWVTNTGNCSDTFDRTVSGNLWGVDAPTAVGPLNPDAGESIDVTVSVPVPTLGGVSDAATVAFASQLPGTGSTSTVLTTTAKAVAPVAVDDPYDATEDVPLVVTAAGTPPGVLHNDDDANGEVLTVSQYTQPTNGAVMLDPDGSFTYTPTLNFDGIDSFTYQASDGVLTDTATVSVTVSGAGDDPVVNAGPDQPGVGDPPIKEGDSVRFAGSFVDPVRQTLLAGETVHWDFGDGNSATGTLTPYHIYLDNDVYTATLTVTDTEGDVGLDSLQVTVLNVPPVVNAGPDQRPQPGELISFAGILTDTVADTHTIQWDLDDGTIIEDNLAFDHAYDTTGDYAVTLTVTDDDGGVGTDTAIITVRYKVYLPLVLRSGGP